MRLHQPSPGDRYLLCSDGVSAVIPDNGIQRVLSAAADPENAVAELMALVDRAGDPQRQLRGRRHRSGPGMTGTHARHAGTGAAGATPLAAVPASCRRSASPRPCAMERGPGVVASLALVLVIGSCAPVGVAVALGALVGRIGHSGNDVLRGMLASVLAFAAIVLIGHAADALARLLEFQARARIDGAHRSRLIRLAASVDGISHLEDPQVQRLIRQAAAEADFGLPTPADGAVAQLRWATGLVGAAVICVILAEAAWWAVPLVLVPALISLCIRARQYFAQSRSLRAAMKEELHADVWRNAASSSAEGKDVRVFGFGEWMIDRMQRHIDLGNTPFWEHVPRIARQSWVQLALILCGLAPVYIMVSRSAAAGHATVSEQTSVLIVGWAVFLSVGTGQRIYEMAGSAAALRAFGELRTLVTPLRGGDRQATARFTGTAAPPLLQFEQVKFSYPGTSREILSGVDLEIMPGEMLAIVGLNGAGQVNLDEAAVRAVRA